MKVEEPLHFRDWALAERPREKFMDKGPESLTDAELVAIMIGTGTSAGSVLDIARKILEAADNNMSRLATIPIKALINIKGVGLANAVKIKALMEAIRRGRYESAPENLKIGSSHDAFRVVRIDLAHLHHEEFWVVLLNRASRVITRKRISQGGLTSTIADPRIIFKLAMSEDAPSIIVAHNHPSGNLTPSQADIDLTRKLVAAGKLLDIQVVDHLIISGNNYCSFADSGLM